MSGYRSNPTDCEERSGETIIAEDEIKNFGKAVWRLWLEAKAGVMNLMHSRLHDCWKSTTYSSLGAGTVIDLGRVGFVVETADTGRSQCLTFGGIAIRLRADLGIVRL